MRLTLRGKLVISILLLIFVALPLTILSGIYNNEAATSYASFDNTNVPDTISLDDKQDYDSDSDILSALTPEAKLIQYDGSIEHIFFHPLIAYPDLAFDGDDISKGYNDWFITVSEFNKILKLLFENNYILVSIHDVFGEMYVDNKRVMYQKELMLPEGKKPIIISIDDLNYYQYMRNNGNVHKLIITAEGEIGTYSMTSDGTEVISQYNEIVPILDLFIKDHPDFSFNGAKGIIALTGYEGILGYRTDLIDAPDYEQITQEALEIAARLKDLGWVFASHSYSHNDANQISYKRLIEDTERWKKEVEILTGPTSIYVYPYGSKVPENDPKYRHLLQSGYNILLSAGDISYVKTTERAISIDRRHIDGIALKQQREKYLDLFDSDDIIDSLRP